MFRRIAVAVGDDDGGTGLVVGEMAFAADSPGRAALKVVAVGTT